MASFGYTGGTGTSILLWGSTMFTRYQNDTGADQYLTTVDLLNLLDAGSHTQWFALYEDNGGLVGRKILDTTIPNLVVGTNTFTLPWSPTIKAGEWIWGCWSVGDLIHIATDSTAPSLTTWMWGDPYHQTYGQPPEYISPVATNMTRQTWRMPFVFNGGGTEIVSSDVAVNLNVVESINEGNPSTLADLFVLDPLTEGNPSLRIPLFQLEPLAEGNPSLRISEFVVESLHPVLPELPMSTEPFPGFGNSVSDPSLPQALDPFNSALPGLSFSVHKKPMFNTKISESPSGNEVRNALAEYPRWDFTMPYEFLEDSSGATSSLKTILGFFLARQGSYDSWLFKDPDDYLVTNGYCGTTDGVTTQFPFCRTLGTFSEKVGQVDTANTIIVYLSPDENATIPATGPYTITVAGASSYIEDLGVTKAGVAMTKVIGAPAAGQYSVDTGTGIYTFNSADASASVIITYRYTANPASYTVTLPNLIVFSSAPAAGTVSASFQFFFACRFLEDQMDFEKFYDKLWALQQCNFRSIIQ